MYKTKHGENERVCLSKAARRKHVPTCSLNRLVKTSVEHLQRTNTHTIREHSWRRNRNQENTCESNRCSNTTHILPLFLVHLRPDSVHVPGEDPELGRVGVQWSRSCGSLPLHVPCRRVCGLAVLPPPWPYRSCQQIVGRPALTIHRVPCCCTKRSKSSGSPVQPSDLGGLWTGLNAHPRTPSGRFLES